MTIVTCRRLQGVALNAPRRFPHSPSARRLASVRAGGKNTMSNTIDLAGRNAVVTGGAQGIGRAIVERFLESGAGVAIWDRDLPLAKKTVGELEKRGRVVAVAADVTQYPDVERARDETVKAFGR